MGAVGVLQVVAVMLLRMVVVVLPGLDMETEVVM